MSEQKVRVDSIFFGDLCQVPGVPSGRCCAFALSGLFDFTF